MHFNTKTIATTTLACALLASMPFALEAGQASPGAAPPQAEQAPVLSTAQGELVAVDAKEKILSVKTTNGDMEFRYDDDTKVTGGQKGVAGLATMSGTPVGIRYRQDGAVNHAVSIEVRSPAPR